MVDLLRRAKVEVTMVSIHEKEEILGAHGIKIQADARMSQIDDYQEFDMVFLPGGGTGTDNLENSGKVKEVVSEFAKKGKKVAAICAAPRILGGLGLLEGRRCTSYRFRERVRLLGGVVTENAVETDGNITTSRGVGTAVDMGLELIRILCGEKRAEEIREEIVYRRM